MSWDDSLGSMDAEAFDRLAAHLDKLRTDGVARVTGRSQRAGAGLSAGRAAKAAWTGPNADRFADDLQRINDRLASVEPRTGRTYITLHELAEGARSVARAVHDVRSLWNDMSPLERARHTVNEELPFTGPVDHPAVQSGRAAVQNWDRLCERVAGELRVAIALLEGAAHFDPPGPSMHRTTENRATDVNRDATRAAWAEHARSQARALEHDREQLSRWWNQLDAAERGALLDRYPELLDGPLGQVLSSADRTMLHDQGQADARELADAVRAAGLDPGGYDAADVSAVDLDGPAGRRLTDLLAELASRRRLDPADRAVGFYQELGPDGTQTLLALLATMRRSNPDRAGPLIATYATALGRNAGAAGLAAVRERLLAADNPTDQYLLDLTLLGDTARYDPIYTAQAARRLLVDGDEVINSPHAYRALANNPEAARRFVLPDADGPVDRQALRALVDTEHLRPPDGARDLPHVIPDATTALGHAILARDDVDPHRIPASTKVYVATIEEIADEGSPVEIRRLAAQALVLHIGDLGEGALSANQFAAAPWAHEVASRDLSHKTLVRFFTELGRDDESVRALSASLTSAGLDVVREIPVGSTPVNDPDEARHDMHLRALGLIVGTARRGLDDAHQAGVDQARSRYDGVALALGAASSLPAGFSSPKVPGGAYAGQVAAYGANQLSSRVLEVLNQPTIEEAERFGPNGAKLENDVVNGLNHELARRGRQAAPDLLDSTMHHDDRFVIESTVERDDIANVVLDRAQFAAGLDKNQEWGAAR